MGIKPTFAKNIAFPLQFTDDGDLVLEEDESVINQSLALVALSSKGSIPLFPDFGSEFLNNVFEPFSQAANIVMDTALRNSLEQQEPRIVIDRQILFDEKANSSTLVIVIPYRVKPTGKLASSRLVVDRNELD